MIKKDRTEYKRQWYQKNKERLRREGKGTPYQSYTEEQKEKHRARVRQYYKENKEAKRRYGEKYRAENKEKTRERNRKWYQDNREHVHATTREYQKKYPWRTHRYSAKSLCTNPNEAGYKYFGGRGIFCRITTEQVKVLYERDGAANMKRPVFSRTDKNKDYTFDNCYFREASTPWKIK